MILAGFAIVMAVAIAEIVMAARWNPSYLTVAVATALESVIANALESAHVAPVDRAVRH
jgi:hypothetical protein